MGGTGLRRRAVALALAVAAVSPAATARAENIDIHRDRFGVPHVFAQTREGVAYGAGYALAQDRLWQMHVFRKATKGELSDLLGPAVVETDKAVRAELYSADERAARFATYRADIRSGLEAFAKGVNAWIAQANSDPRKLPFEFREFGVVPVPQWTVDDSLALQDYLILTFGAGGGNEVGQLALLQDLKARHGATEGQKAFDDLVHTVNPEAPSTVPAGFNYPREPVHADDKKVNAIRRLENDARLQPSTTSTGTRTQARLATNARALAKQIARHDDALAGVFKMFKFGSNAQIVGPQLGAAGNTLQTGGPQVDYAVPQYLADIGLHGGGIEATGMTFAGVGPAVLIGRGPGYAWTTTTGSSDLADTYIERLNPDDPRRSSSAANTSRWPAGRSSTPCAARRPRRRRSAARGTARSSRSTRSRASRSPGAPAGSTARARRSPASGTSTACAACATSAPRRTTWRRTTTCSTSTTRGTSATGIRATTRSAPAASTCACRRTARAGASGRACSGSSTSRTPSTSTAAGSSTGTTRPRRSGRASARGRPTTACRT
jgi:hypothetical protein